VSQTTGNHRAHIVRAVSRASGLVTPRPLGVLYDTPRGMDARKHSPMDSVCRVLQGAVICVSKTLTRRLSAKIITSADLLPMTPTLRYWLSLLFLGGSRLRLHAALQGRDQEIIDPRINPQDVRCIGGARAIHLQDSCRRLLILAQRDHGNGQPGGKQSASTWIESSSTISDMLTRSQWPGSWGDRGFNGWRSEALT
jgi:hypothetical protein